VALGNLARGDGRAVLFFGPDAGDRAAVPMPEGAPGAPGAVPGAGGNEYTLSFDTGEDGEPAPPVYAGAGSSVTLPALPDRDGLPTPGYAEHRAYMLGYPDGDFRPDEGISRAETVVMFTRLLEETPDPEAPPGRFSDIRGSAWYADVLGSMEKYSIVKGYPNGEFRPDSDISRAEFVSVCLRLAEKKEDGAAPAGNGTGDEAGALTGTGDGAGARPGDAAAGLLSAVPQGHWARGAIGDAARRGWLDACAEGGPVFAPDGRITRAEAVTVINRMLLRRADMGYIRSHSLTGFRDVPPGHWAYGDITEASHDHAFTIEDGEERWSPLSGAR
jgi:hypothetical protein